MVREKEDSQPKEDTEARDKEESMAVSTEEEEVKGEPSKNPEAKFVKVTRSQWGKMTYKERKSYLKERRRWKTRNTVFIKDDSDQEQLSEGEEQELEWSSSEGEEEKEDRLAKEALKSYTGG